MKVLAVSVFIAIGILLALALLERYFHPTRRIELHLLATAINHGAGWDDAAQEILHKHSSRYAPEIIRMLATATPGSKRESTALSTVEMVAENPNVREALTEFGCAHQDVETVALVAWILEGTLKRVPVKGLPGVSVLPRQQMKSGTLAEERAKIGCPN